MTIKQQGGVFGRHPSFESIELNGQDLQTELNGKADLTGDTFTGQVNVNVPTTGGVTVTSTGNCEIVAARTAGASVRMQAQSAAGTLGTTSNHRFDLLSNGSARLRIETNADVNVLSGNLIIGTSGKGIDFSATSGTGTSELFDDYEEGTWTPVFQGSTSGSKDLGAIGKYTKIGRMVHVAFYATNADFSSAAIVGTVELSGLPFNIATLGYGLGNIANNNLITGGSDYVPYSYSANKLRFSGGSTAQLSDAGLTQSASRYIAIALTYEAA